MSLKAKLVSTIAAFCMVICLLSVGIWAAGTGIVNIGGSVSFTAGDINVSVEGTATGAAQGEKTLTKFTWNAETVTPEGQSNLTEEWNLTGLTFAKEKSTVDPEGGAEPVAEYFTGNLADIVIELTITNLSQERAVEVVFAAATSDPEGKTKDSSVSIAVTKAGAALTDSKDTITAAASAEGNAVVYTITISTTKNANQTVALTNFDVDVTLNNVENQ